jgi:hypothetical protein
VAKLARVPINQAVQIIVGVLPSGGAGNIRPKLWRRHCNVALPE